MLSVSARIRNWLIDNPGWHQARDVQDGIGANGVRARQTVSALLSNFAAIGTLDRSGTMKCHYRYKANNRTNWTGDAKPGPSPIEQAFEDLCRDVLAMDLQDAMSATQFIEEVRKRSGQIQGHAPWPPA